MRFPRPGFSGAFACILVALVLGSALDADARSSLPRAHPRVSDPFYGRSHIGPRYSSSRLDENRGAAANVLRANGLCREAFVAEFAVGRGVTGIPAHTDYCQLAPKHVPLPVRETLSRLKTLHLRVSELFGKTPARLLGFGARVQLRAHPAGPLMSGTDDLVRLSVFPDYHAGVFPEKIYLHELTHWLLLEGKLGPAANALEPSYLFYESFPDLVASYVSESNVIDFRDPGLRPSLTFPRDGSPIRSMRRPFAEFYVGKFQEEAVDLCREITPSASRVTTKEIKLCEFYRREKAQLEAEGSLFDQATTRPPGRTAMNENFRAEHCVVRYRDGTAGLDACNVFALGPVLISFVRSIDPFLGDLPLASFLEAISSAGQTADRLRCRFVAPPPSARSSMNDVEIVVPDLVTVLRSMRENLNPIGKAVFDRAWESHGLDEWVKLEAFYREFEVERMGYELLLAENSEYGIRYGCQGETPSSRARVCRATCTSESAADSAINAFGS